MTVAEWAERYRYLSAETSALPGKYSLTITPYLRGILIAITERGVRKVVCRKSAQVGWTDGVVNNFLGYTMHAAPAPIGIMFPRDQNAKDYNVEKFTPMIEASPALAELVNTKTRTLDNTQNRKRFPGGFLKLFGSNSTSGVKSTPLKYGVIEEPDDCNLNIKGQGDSIKLLEERVKTFHDSRIIAGGTPTILGVSSIDAEMEASDKRVYLVPCHECGEAHELDWGNVHWPEEEGRAHPLYRNAVPDRAWYTCPHCGLMWNDAQKNRNVRRAEQAGFGWLATAPFTGVAGFSLNELYSGFNDSRLCRLVEKYLAAKHEEELGELGALIAFTNSSLGKSYAYKSDAPEADALIERAEDYEQLTAPWGVLSITAGVDVQHDRLAVSIWGWGRGEEAWLLYWGEIYGQTVVAHHGAWAELESVVFDVQDRPDNGKQYGQKLIQHVGGARLAIRAMTVDTSDGTITQDAAYSFCRKHRGRGVMAGKGASESTDDKRPIFAPPRPAVDADKKQKAWKFGLRPYMVGTVAAKDLLIEGRLKLLGTGPGRIHFYKKVRSDWFDQITSEIKAPHRTIRKRKVWQKKAGVNNEALDTFIYAFHAARSLKLNLLRESHWAALEQMVRQQQLLAVTHDEQPEADAVADAGEEAADRPHTSPAEAPEPAEPEARPVAHKPPSSKHRHNRPAPRGGFSPMRW